MYKPSKFNVYKNNNENLIIFNTLSSGIIELDSARKTEFYKFVNGEDSLTDELFNNLKKGKMIFESSCDELEYIDLMSKISRLSNQALGLTIAPTLECNFACPYCYEKGHRYNTMSDKMIDNVFQFIERNMKDKEELGISWYGGEPLLALEIIEKITQRITRKNYKYSATMVSNGYLLNRATAKKLKELHIDSIQLTIDGPEKIHNQRRILRNGEGSYKRILDNIVEACNILNITVRVNVDKDNIEEVDVLLDDLDRRNLRGKLALYLAPIDNINDTCNSEKCFTSKEFAIEKMRFYNKHFDRGYLFLNVPSQRFGICGAVSMSSFVIDPTGDLYKCWDDIGHKDEKVGNVLTPVKLEGKLLKWLNYSCLTDNQCKNCEVVPICMGGCPNRVMKHNATERSCDHLKYVSDEYLTLIKKEHELKSKLKNI